MSKMYKVIFNKNEVIVESNKSKTISKNKSEMNVIANDVLDCLNKAKELFFSAFDEYPKSIEVNNKFESKDELKQSSKKMIDLSILFEDSLSGPNGGRVGIDSTFNTNFRIY